MITAIIQARMSSTRLPGKVLLPLEDTTVLGYATRRVRASASIAQVVIATSDLAVDDPIAAECKNINAPVFRGSHTDVLDRYYRAAVAFQAAHICRITADCPLVDPTIIDRVAEMYKTGVYDYVSTGREHTTFPDGMDTEVFSLPALERAWKEAELPSEREHVTPYIWKRTDTFRIGEIENSEDLSRIRLTLDEPADYDVVRHIAEKVRPLKLNAMVEYLAAHPEVADLNGGLVRDAGYAKSLKEDNEKTND